MNFETFIIVFVCLGLLMIYQVGRIFRPDWPPLFYTTETATESDPTEIQNDD